MSNKVYTAEQLADRWLDLREIQNLIGRYAYDELFKRQGTMYANYWTAEQEPELVLNNGGYKGAEAVKGWYAVYAANTETVSALVKEMFPDYLGKKSRQELHGVGTCDVASMFCPVIELAEDGKTAKGAWIAWHSDNEIYEYGPYSYYDYGYLAADFVRENGVWKIWHLREISDLRVPMGQQFTQPWNFPEIKPEFAAIADLKLPEPTHPFVVRESYSVERETQPLVKLPEPYETFADTFSYGI